MTNNIKHTPKDQILAQIAKDELHLETLGDPQERQPRFSRLRGLVHQGRIRSRL